jgi:nicotinate-nucleotide adenylyltransferase
VFVVGSELLPQIPHWRQAEALLANVQLAVAPRQGWPLHEADLERLRLAGARIQLLPLEIPATASRLVREAPGGHPDPSLVPDELWPLLCRHGLYGLAEPSPPP